MSRAAARATAPLRPVTQTVAEVLLDAKSALSKIDWSLSYAAFLYYIGGIVTQRTSGGQIAMALALLGLTVEGGKLRLPAFLVWMGAFLVWCIIGYTDTMYTAFVEEQLIVFAKVWLIVLVAVNTLRTPARIRFFMIFTLGCFAIYPARGTLLNYFVTHNTLQGRAIWQYVYENPNDLAALTLLQLSVVAAVLVTERARLLRLAAWAGAFVLPLIILVTQSRGAYLALAAFVLGVVTRGRKKLRQLAVVGLLGVVIFMSAPSGIMDRFMGLKNVAAGEGLSAADEYGSAEARFEIWRVAAYIVNQDPFTGVGFGAYKIEHAFVWDRVSLNPTVRGPRDTHSTYINVLAETGVPGLLLFLTLLGSAIAKAERSRHRCRHQLPKLADQIWFLELGLVGFLTAGIFGTFVRLSYLYIAVALMWCVAELADEQMAQLKRSGALAGTALPHQPQPQQTRPGRGGLSAAHFTSGTWLSPGTSLRPGTPPPPPGGSS